MNGPNADTVRPLKVVHVAIGPTLNEAVCVSNRSCEHLVGIPVVLWPRFNNNNLEFTNNTKTTQLINTVALHQPSLLYLTVQSSRAVARPYFFDTDTNDKNLKIKFPSDRLRHRIIDALIWK